MSDEVTPAAKKDRLVRFEHSQSFVPLLQRLGGSILISTYQAGKLVVVGTDQQGLALGFYNFDRPMGLAVGPDRLALAARDSVWILRAAPDIASRIEPAGRFDQLFAARSAAITGDIQAHEAAWVGDQLWVVNTLFSCICTVDAGFSFVPRWRPPFITGLAAEDRCHLNGMAMADGRPKFVTFLGETVTPRGWRPVKTTGGCLMDVASGQVVVRGLCMPHSPRVQAGQLWVLDSGRGHLCVADPSTERTQMVAALPGYTRGLAFHGGFAFVGLSKIRETSTFGGVPVAERREELKCGLGIVELATGRLAAHLEFAEGVDEIFDVQVLPGVRLPKIVGPHPEDDGGQTVWIVPNSARTGADQGL
ncbi:MAG TPA: TIGR03032 family protein [Gemmataceae bacterium]|nr:TIGR03032 family protein [Gemmataceae bacterium]